MRVAGEYMKKTYTAWSLIYPGTPSPLNPQDSISLVLQRLLDFPTPTYRHHLLLLEERGDKLAKLHGAVGWSELRGHYEPRTLCGILAFAAGLTDEPRSTTPRELLGAFSWQRVRAKDQTLRWTGTKLEIVESL